MSKNQTYVSWGAQIIAAAILAMAMVPKFISAPEAIDTFTTLGVEPWGRYVVAIGELLAVVLLVTPFRQHALGGYCQVEPTAGRVCRWTTARPATAVTGSHARSSATPSGCTTGSA